MNPGPTPSEPRLARWIYGRLLRLYPAAFRARYGEEMTRIFADEWQHAAAEGIIAQCRYGLHLAWDIAQAAPREWLAVFPRAGVMLIAAAALGIGYVSLEPVSLLLRVVACALLTCVFAVLVVVASGRSRKRQFKLAALGIVIGFVLAPLLRLNPELAPPPETPLVPVAARDLTGPEIYRRVRETYRNAKTYVDQGEVQTVFSGGRAFTEIKTFDTTFVRAGGFRFRFQAQFDRLDDWNVYAIWKDGPVVKRWWTIQPELRTDGSLERELGGAAGVSGLASVQIPGLLEPGLRMGNLTAGNAPVELLGTQRLDGRDTFKLQFTMPRGPVTTLWVDARSYLVVRTARRMSFAGPMRTDEVIVYRPQVSVAVDPAALTFQPPAARSRWWAWVGGRNVAMYLVLAGTLLAVMMNRVHLRLLRHRWRPKKEAWLAVVMRRMWAGYAAIAAICLGMWLWGIGLDEATRNFMLAQLALQGGLLLYAMHRRSRGYARFAAG